MKKAGFIGSFVCAILGSMTLIAASMIREIMPKLGYMMYQAAAAGAYSPDSYALDFTLPSVIAGLMIAFGVGFGAYCFWAGKADRG